MSAQWSLTYLRTDASVEELFETVVNAFLLEIDDQLYDLEYRNSSYVDVKTSRAIIEKFHDATRSRIIVDSCQLEWYNRGVIVYPRKEGLFTLVDTVIHIGNIAASARSRREELAKDLVQKPDHFSNSLFLYISFLSHLTKSLNVQAIHIMFERNPAGSTTSVHCYDRGKLEDDFFFENIACDGRYGLIELPQKPAFVRHMIDGRFAFLVDQPKIRQYDEQFSVEAYFDGEDLHVNDPDWDVLNVRASRLYVPSWDEASQPFGAIYCPTKELPAHFLARYQ